MTSMFGAWLGRQRLEIQSGPAEHQPLPTFLTGRPHQKWGFFGVSFPLSVSTSLMVGVGSGSKHFHALGVLACGPLKPPSGARREPWVSVGRAAPASTPRAFHGAAEVQCWVFLGRAEVLPISGSGAASLGSSSPSPCGTVLSSLRAAALELTPLSLAATPAASGSLTCALRGAGVRVVSSWP